MTKIRYQVHIREHTSRGVKLPEEFTNEPGVPSGVFKMMTNGGFVAWEPPKIRADYMPAFRWAAFCQPVEIVEGHLIIPRLYVRLGLLPGYGEKVVLFGDRTWLEVWPVDRWIEEMRTTAANLQNVLAAVKDELDARS